jgi:RHS repeat-associated protein
VTIGRKGCRSGRCPAATVCTAGPCASRSRPRCRNRASKTTGGTTVATSFDAANRPTSDSGGGSYGHDAEGRMTARPGQTLEWDSLGRLTKVRDSSTNAVISSYTYDALDRLREETRGGTTQRFRYVGTTTRVAQIWNVTTSASVLYYGIGWDGDILAGWLNPSGGRRYFGTNAHGDITWTTDGPGAVNRTLRYDPWGETIATSGTGLPPFRFQGSWRDGTANLYWVVARWYAPTLGTFVSEDELLGQHESPATRHLYGYAIGDPIGRWDPDGQASWRPRYRTARFTNTKGLRGKVILSSFIPTCQLRWDWYLDILGVGVGDCRGFRRAPNCTASRFCITVDFTRSVVKFRVNESCVRLFFKPHEDHCYRAVAYKTGYRRQHSGFNWVAVRTLGDRLVVNFSMRNAATFIIPAIDGILSVYMNERKVSVMADAYPSFEMFYIAPNGATSTLLQRAAASHRKLHGPMDWARSAWLPASAA